ncbi:MAG: metallophosphoesterase [Clostridia bacterium]|nr:metallophosphoesterase [Clostridia bacterium]
MKRTGNCRDPKTKESAFSGYKLRIAAISDTHITPALHRRTILIRGMKKLKKLSPDVVVFAGDCTDNGNTSNWNAFADIIKKYCGTKERVIALGNHDTWITYACPHDYLPAKENYLRYSNMLTGSANEEVYFREEKCGCTFLVMGSEGTSVAADISDDQLLWLENELKTCDESKPVFVINHQPLNFTHGVGDNENGMGINGGASEKLRDILEKRKNAVYICGHVHLGLGENVKKRFCYSTVENIGEATSICLPCFEYGSFFMGGSPLLGTGMLIDVYDNRLVITGMDLMRGAKMKSFRRDILLGDKSNGN